MNRINVTMMWKVRAANAPKFNLKNTRLKQKERCSVHWKPESFRTLPIISSYTSHRRVLKVKEYVRCALCIFGVSVQGQMSQSTKYARRRRRRRRNLLFLYFLYVLLLTLILLFLFIIVRIFFLLYPYVAYGVTFWSLIFR